MNPKYRRYADRLRELVEEGRSVAKLERPSSYSGVSIQGDHQIQLQAWLVKAINILETVFDPHSPHVRHFKELTSSGPAFIEHSSQVLPIVGVLSGALDDLENGYLLGQEFLIAAEVFDSVLEQAKYLNGVGHKDPAAVLARVVLEDSLKRLANGNQLNDTQSPSRMNDELKSVGLYPQPQWRLIQAWLDIGNAAAHGKFADYDQDGVKKLIEGIERFLATDFRI